MFCGFAALGGWKMYLAMLAAFVLYEVVTSKSLEEAILDTLDCILAGALVAAGGAYLDPPLEG